MQVLSGFLRPRWDMDDKELSLWVLSLGDSWNERIKTLEEMILHEKEDHMSDDDKLIVRAALTVVREQSYREAPIVKNVVAPHPKDDEPKFI